MITADELAEMNMNQARKIARQSPVLSNLAICTEGPCLTKAPRRPEVQQELEELGCAIDALEQAFFVLHDRLSMVTRVLPPGIACPPEGNDALKVPLSNIISEYRKRVRVFQNIVTELTDRVEV